MPVTMTGPLGDVRWPWEGKEWWLWRLGHVPYGSLRICMCLQYISGSLQNAKTERRNTLCHSHVILGLSLTF